MIESLGHRVMLDHGADDMNFLPPVRRSCDYSVTYSSSSSPASASFFSAALAFFLFTRPGRPPPSGDVSAKSMCFCESRRTMKDGTLTICLPTLYMG